MAIMTTAQFKTVCSPIMTEVFNGIYKKKPAEFSKYMEVVTGIGRSYHPETMLYGFGAAPEKTQGDGVYYDAGGEQYTFNYPYKVYSLGAAITQEAIMDGEWEGLVSNNAKHLTVSGMETKETLCANIFNRGTDATVVYGDGQPFFSAAHPQYAGTQSNLLGSAALSQTSLEASVAQIWNARDFRGKRISLKAKALLAGPSNYQQAIVLMNAQLRAGSANTDVSPFRFMDEFPDGAIKVTRFSSTTFWAVTTDVEDGLKVVQHPGGKAQLTTEGDFNSNTMRQKFTERYAVGLTNYLAAYGNAGV